MSPNVPRLPRSSSKSLLHLLLLLLLQSSMLQTLAQLQMPSSYLPKEYFLSDGGRRDPRHVPSDYQAAGSTSASTTSTYHLNPQDPTNSLGLATTSTSSAIHAMNNQFGIRLVPHDQLRSNNGAIGGGDSSSRRTRRRSKGSTRHRRRLPKSLLRPPKEYIIYSLPEQSFWAPETPQSNAEERSLGGGQQRSPEEEQNRGRSENDQSAEEEEGAPLPTPGHLRSGGLDREEDDEQEERGRGSGGGGGDQREETQRFVEEASPSEEPPREQGQQSVEHQEQLEEPQKNNVVDLSDAPNPTLSERKVLLGQCMRSCIDALL